MTIFATLPMDAVVGAISWTVDTSLPYVGPTGVNLSYGYVPERFKPEPVFYKAIADRLVMKCGDRHFPSIVESIIHEGQQRPITLIRSNDSYARKDIVGWHLGNGHHRLAALIGLDAPMVDVVFHDDTFGPGSSGDEHRGYGQTFDLPEGFAETVRERFLELTMWKWG